MASAQFKNNPNARQTFTVVPPQTPKSSSPALETPQLRPNSSPQDTQRSPIVKPQKEAEKFPQKTPLRGLITVGAIALAVGTIGFIPIPNYVTGQTEITSRTNARQLLTMPVSGRVKIHVRTNQQIQPNQLVAEIQSDELDNQLTEAERELERAKLGVNSARQQLIVSQARLNATQNNEAIARNRTNRQLTDASNSTSHPQIQRLEREKEIIPNEIAAIEADITGIEAEIIGLREQVTSAAQTVNAYESLQVDGAIRRKDLWDARAQQAALEAQIQQRESLIEAKRRQIQQKHSQIAAKSEQINEADKQMGDLLYNYEDDLAQTRSQTQTAQQELEAAATEVQAQQQLVQKWETHLQQLHQQREKLRIFAGTAGTVITPDLDLKNNTRWEAGQEILSVVDLEQLTAEVQIRQEDKDLVEPGAGVKFYRQGGTIRYAASVQDEGISPVVRTEENQQKPMLKVRILIDNKDRLLLPGVKGYAHIQT
ncbi:MAG: HlyD family efflux transporter periplasmic adaptor subunit, partial [Cyanobacteriota bacterium]|nr:HlyD family efflux transporter periplasmic adaptor subunit [Cyanobacteriota bacterium]